MEQRSAKPSHTETVEIKGHIIDSLILPKILDEIVASGAEYEVLTFEIGKTHQDPSFARIQVWAPDEESLQKLLRRLHRDGADPVDLGEAVLKPSDMDGAFPESFYSTTNLPTQVRVGDRWIPVANPEMDCGIVVEGDRAFTLPMADVRTGQMVVTGHSGLKVSPLERPRGKQIFEFMASDISSEKPKEIQIELVAGLMHAVRQSDRKLLWVVGPAVVHTGSGPALSSLVAGGWVDVLFAGNGFAAHDIEAAMFGTSLGINLELGTPAESGHEHHIRAINSVRRAGSIAAAVERGILSQGVMYELIRERVPFVLGGSVRDDGPLPETVTDVIEAQRQMRALTPDVGLGIIVSSMLHGIATGNILPASVPIVCVDINPATVTKLLDRGSIQSVGLVTDVGLFVKELTRQLLGTSGIGPTGR
jgi:lysine-ketoglutarate reductase/saccharopine dehydrogenase-like protein (TIGR00300 family)